MTQTWVYALVAIAIVHFLATVGLYYYLSRRTPANEEGSAEPSPATTERVPDSITSQSRPGDDYVVCSNCETPNEPGYRYCRQCVAPLGSASGSNREGRGPNAPWIR